MRVLGPRPFRQGPRFQGVKEVGFLPLPAMTGLPALTERGRSAMRRHPQVIEITKISVGHLIKDRIPPN